MDRPVAPGHFSGPLNRHGDGAFTVSVGGIAVQFSGLSEALLPAAQERYSPFLSDEPPLHTVVLYDGPEHYLDMAEDGFMRVEERDFPEGRIMVSHDFAAFWPAGASAGTLRVSVAFPLSKVLSAMENYLRWCVADLAIERGGFVLHSAGLVLEGKAYVFFGHSGAGKSTATTLSLEGRGALALSDDLVLLLREGDRFLAAATPFQGSMAQRVKEKGLCPLAGLFHLRQSAEVGTLPLARAAAVGMLLSCCPFVADPGRRSEYLLPIVEDLCRAVPVRELLFRKDPSFWDVVLKREDQP